MSDKKVGEHTFVEKLFAVVFVFILIPIFLYFTFLRFSEDKKQFESNETISNGAGTETDSEYGSYLSECLQKADAWLADAKQTAKSVLAEEKTKNSPYQGYINQNAPSENEIIASLETEWRDYQNECWSHFR